MWSGAPYFANFRNLLETADINRVKTRDSILNQFGQVSFFLLAKIEVGVYNQ